MAILYICKSIFTPSKELIKLELNIPDTHLELLNELRLEIFSKVISQSKDLSMSTVGTELINKIYVFFKEVVSGL